MRYRSAPLSPISTCGRSCAGAACSTISPSCRSGCRAPSIAVGILLAFIRPPFSIYGTIWILLVAYVARFIPLATRSVNATFRQIDPSLEEAARITGASWLTSVRRILVPLSRPGLLVAFLLVFIPAFGELSATILLYTGGTETIAVAIYRLNDLGQLEVVSALAVFTIGVILTLSLLVSCVVGPGRSMPGRRRCDDTLR